jgi:hypothetical protein
MYVTRAPQPAWVQNELVKKWVAAEGRKNIDACTTVEERPFQGRVSYVK